MAVRGQRMSSNRAKVAWAGMAVVLMAGCTNHTAANTAASASQTPGHIVVVLDPGHNGGNATHLATINQLVPDGRGTVKACNTTGTTTDTGYGEHAFNWDVANRIRTELETHGIDVVMTRKDDESVGPCVNERAAIGNRAAAAVVVSIHADAAATDSHGFHVNYSYPALNPSQDTQSPRLARTLRDALVGAGFSPANYIGADGLYPRSDLAGLNLSDRPTALVECGNMHNPDDAAVQTSADGRQRYADAVTAGIRSYLGR